MLLFLSLLFFLLLVAPPPPSLLLMSYNLNIFFILPPLFFRASLFHGGSPSRRIAVSPGLISSGMRLSSGKSPGKSPRKSPRKSPAIIRQYPVKRVQRFHISMRSGNAHIDYAILRILKHASQQANNFFEGRSLCRFQL